MSKIGKKEAKFCPDAPSGLSDEYDAIAVCLPMSQTDRAGCGRLDAHKHHVNAKKSGNQNETANDVQ
jgi:hypothetical protein